MGGSLTIGSLFSGIGGLELGLEWAGLGPVLWQVEKEPFCREVLAKHWPDVPRFHDVCGVGVHNLPAADLLCGGFPCQDLSLAGKGEGLDGERSGLWFEYARIVGEVRPRFVVVENVAALLNRGLDRVLGTLASLGYDAWWDCIPAAAVGAPHKRDRLFVVAWRVADTERARRDRLHERDEAGPLAPDATDRGEDVAHGNGERRQWTGTWEGAAGRPESADGGQDVADAGGHGLLRGPQCDVRPERGQQAQRRHDADGLPLAGRDAGRTPLAGVGRAVDGVPRWMDRGWPAPPGGPRHAWEAPRTTPPIPNRAARLRGLGNAVSPAVGYVVGCAVRYLDSLRGEP